MPLSHTAILSRCTMCNFVSYDAPDIDSLPASWQHVVVNHFPDGSGEHCLCPACAKKLDVLLGVVDPVKKPSAKNKPKAEEPKQNSEVGDLIDEINQLRNTLKNQGRHEDVADACVEAPPRPVMEWGVLGVEKLKAIRDRLVAVDGVPF